MISEVFLLSSIFLLCVLLAFEDLRSAFVFFLLVSPLLHKEVFSLVRWDILPVRVVMLSLIFTCCLKFLFFLRKNKTFSDVKRYLQDPVLLLLLVLLAVRIVSIINTKNLTASLVLLSFYITMIFLYTLLSFLAEKYKETFVLSNLKFYCLIALSTAFIAVIQLIADAKFGFAFGAIWRIPGKLSRVGSVFWDVNHYAGFLAAIIPVMFAFYFNARSRFSKIFYLCSTLFMTVILLLTNSRSAWIGFAVSMLILFLHLFVTKFGKRKLLYAFLALFLSLFLGYVSYNMPQSIVREKIKSYLHYRGDSFAAHLYLLEGAFAIFEKYPLIGGGYGSFFEHFKETYVASVYYGRDPAALSVRVPAHSIWGEIISETGAVGLFVFVVLIFYMLATIILAMNAEENKNRKILFLSFCVSFISYLVSGLFYSYNSEFFYLTIFLGFIYSKTVLGDNYNFTQLSRFINTSKVLSLIFILLITVFLVFVSLGANHLIPWDEAIYAKISKNMLYSRNYLTQSWELGKIWYEKPPLYMWLTSVFMGVFGIGSFSVKFTSAFFGVLTILLVFITTRKLFGNSMALITSIALLTNIHFLFYSRIGMLDVTLTFFIFASLISYFFFTKNRLNRKLMIVSGASFGLAFMTKGVASILILPVIFLYELILAYTEKRNLFKEVKSYLLFFVSFAVISVPWHLYMYLTFGEKFISNYFGYHVFKRAVSSIEGKGKPFFWYIDVMRVSMRVWYVVLSSYLVLLASYFSMKKLAYKSEKLRNILEKFSDIFENKDVYFFILSSLVFYLFFSYSVSKLVWYVIPMYPFVYIVCGFFVSKLITVIPAPDRSLGQAPAGIQLAESGTDYELDSRLRGNDNSGLKFILSLLVCFISLMYFFTVRNMVYVYDDTGDYSELIVTKDRLFGTTEPLYYDRLEKPIPMFYSDGPVVAVDYNPLVKFIKNAKFNEPIIYITKESRFSKLSAMFPSTDMVEQRSEFVLARVRPEEELLKAKISSLEFEIKWIEKESKSGNDEALSKVVNLPTLNKDLEEMKADYRIKLSSIKN